MDLARQGASTPVVSIVIPTWNAVEGLLKCLKALGAHTPNLRYEVIVVDNGSTDATAKVLSQLSFVRVLTNANNLGFARACNQGAALAKAPLLLFLNDDAQPQAGWLPALIAALNDDPTVGLASAKLIHIDTRIEQAGYALAYASPYPLSPLPQFRRQPFAALTQTRKFSAVTASCLLIRTNLFRQLEGFDEGFINGMEDVDLCLRAQKRQLLSVVVGNSVVLHEPRFSAERTAFAKQNMERLNQRWKPHELKLDSDFRQLAPPRSIGTPRPPLSIIVVAQDALGSAAACVEHALAHAQVQDEVLLVDDGASVALTQWAQNRMKGERRLRRVASAPFESFVTCAAMGLKQARHARTMVIPATLRLDANCLQAAFAETSAAQTEGVVTFPTGPSRDLNPLGPYEPRRPLPKIHESTAPLQADVRITSGALAGDRSVMTKVMSNLARVDSPAALPAALQALHLALHVAPDAAVHPFSACDHVVPSRQPPPPKAQPGATVVAVVRAHTVESVQRCLRELYEWGLRADDVWLLPSPMFVQASDLDAIDEAKGTRRAPASNQSDAEAINGIVQSATCRFFALIDDQVHLPTVAAASLVTHLHSHPKLAFLGPLLNVFKGTQVAPQTVELPHAPDLALRLSWQNRSQTRSTMNLDPHCLFGSREALLQLGGFDPRFGIFDYALDDLIGRARFHGMLCQVALDAYAHFSGKRVLPPAQQAANRAQLLEKWKLIRDAKGLPVATAFLTPPLSPSSPEATR